MPRESDARGRIGPGIAEHHRLDRHRRAPIVGNGVQRAIGDGTRIFPAFEDGADRAPELVMDILRERLVHIVQDGLFVSGNEGP